MTWRDRAETPKFVIARSPCDDAIQFFLPYFLDCFAEPGIVEKTASSSQQNPSRMAADGFWAEQSTLNKTPRFTGPVKRASDFLSTGGSTAGGLTQRNRPCRCSTPVSSSACDPLIVPGLKREARLRVRSRASTTWMSLVVRERSYDLGCARHKSQKALQMGGSCMKLLEAVRHHSGALRCATCRRKRDHSTTLAARIWRNAGPIRAPRKASPEPSTQL
jgi:hypothetical protein